MGHRVRWRALGCLVEWARGLKWLCSNGLRALSLLSQTCAQRPTGRQTRLGPLRPRRNRSMYLHEWPRFRLTRTRPACPDHELYP